MALHCKLPLGHRRDVLRTTARAEAGKELGTRVLHIRYGLFMLAFALFVAGMAMAEQLRLPRAWIGAAFLLVTVAAYASIGLLCREQSFVSSYLDWQSMFGRNPVKSCFYLTTIWCISPFCHGVIRAVNFQDISFFVFNHIAALYEISIS